MQRPEVWTLSAVLLLLLVLQRAASAASKAKSYFSMDANGSYRYAYDTGNGMAGAQSADPANEVTGHYTYVERGVPYTVRYRAGVKGYQPKVISAAPPAQTALNFEHGLQPVLATTTGSAQQINSHATTTVHAFDNVGGARNTQPTLQFIEAALQSMQSQPLQLSFNSQHGQVQHLSPVGGTARPPALVSHAEVAQINRILEAPPAAAIATAEAAVRPYAFAYGSNADLSARSESADGAGNVVGKYSYRDEAGFHEIAYKAADGTGFQIVGGNLNQNIHSNFNHLNLNRNSKLILNTNSNLNSNIKSNINSNFNTQLNSNQNSNQKSISNLNLNLNQNANLNQLLGPNLNFHSYSNSNLHSNLIRNSNTNSNSNSFSHVNKPQSTPQLLVSVTHEPHGSYNYKVEPLHHIVSNALKHSNAERASRKF